MGFCGEDPRGKVPSLITSYAGALINTINLTYHCWRWPWSPGAGRAVKYLLCCICVTLILVNFRFNFVWFWFLVGNSFNCVVFHGRISSCGLFVRVLWIAERNALDVILALLLNSSFAVLSHVSWALVSNWRKHSLQRCFFLAMIWKEKRTLRLSSCASALWFRISRTSMALWTQL